MLILVFCVLGLWACSSPPPPTPWVRLQHPYVPVFFDAPSTMHLRPELLYWGNGRLVQKNGIGERFVEYGMRTVYRNPNVSAIEIKFAWLDERHAIAPPMTLEKLYRHIYDANQVIDFYIATFHTPDGREPVHNFYRDVGPIVIDGRAARYIQHFWPPEPERTLSSIYLVPLDPQNALVIKVHFVQATDEERNIIAPQIINSIKIDFPPAH